MSLTVITLKKVPDSLRGDLTRWMQEIATGVYIGNYNSRVREYLWKRVTDAIGKGEAIMCFSCRNEIGYSFCTCNTERQVVDFDGIPLVLSPEDQSLKENQNEKQQGFSNASKYYRANRKVRAQNGSHLQIEMNEGSSTLYKTQNASPKEDLVFLDIETTGLNADCDQIIEIGAIKISGGKKIEFHRLIRTDAHIPDAVRNLTGITEDMLRNGTSMETSIQELDAFIQGATIVGYNISFDIRFLDKARGKVFMGPIHNKKLELMQEAKRRNSFQTNYKFETTLKEYGIYQAVHHRALEDARLMYRLYIQMELE